METNQKSHNALTIGSAFGNLASFAGISATFVLILSVVHEYFYFWLIGREFMTILTPSDLLKLAILWLPITISGIFVGMSVNYADMRARVRAYAAHGEQGLTAWKKPDRSMKYAIYFAATASFLSIPSMTWDTTFILYFPFYLAILAIVSKFYQENYLPLQDSPLAAFAFYTITIALLVSAVFFGVRDAVIDLKRTEPVFYVKSTEHEANIVLLEHFRFNLVRILLRRRSWRTRLA